MRVYETQSRAVRTAKLLILAASLAALAACQDAVTGPPVDTAQPASNEVTSFVSKDHADAGEEIRVSLELPQDFVENPYGVVRVTITWDPLDFEYLGTVPLRGLQVVASDLEAGWITIQTTDPELLDRELISLVFVALRDADTSSFHTHALINSAPLDG